MATKLNELPTGHATPNQVLAQGFMANAPLLCFGAVMTSAAVFAGGSLPLAYVLGAVVVWLWINTPFQYSKYLASSGGAFYMAAKSLGGLAGYWAGICYVLYYTAFSAAGAVYIGVAVPDLIRQLGWGSPPQLLWVPLTIAALVLPAVLLYSGVKPSLRYGLVTALIQVATLAITSLVIVIRAGHLNTARVFTPGLTLHHGFSGLGVGMLLAAFGMSGSTATIFLGREANQPHATIRRALIGSTAGVAVIFVFVAYALTIGWGPDRMSSFAGSAIPGLIVIGHYAGAFVEVVVALFLVNSVIAAVLSSAIVVTRTCHAMANATLLPRWMRHVDERRSTPTNAVICWFVAALVAAIGAVLAWGTVTAFVVLILVGTLGEFGGHLLLDFCLPVFAARRRVWRTTFSLLLPSASFISIAFGVYYTFVPPAFPASVGLFAIGGALALAALYYGLRRRRASPAERVALTTAIDRTGVDLGAEGQVPGEQVQPAGLPERRAETAPTGC